MNNTERTGPPAMSVDHLKKNILIVEDDLDIRKGLTELLEIEGFVVTSASNGADGLDQLRSAKSDTRPDLILLDLFMPVKDGVEFRIEQSRDTSLSKIPVILMSADKQASKKTNELGFSGHLKKPIELDQLMSKVSQFCN